MIFLPKNIKQLPENSPVGIRSDRAKTLLLISVSGLVTQAKTVSDKDNMLSKKNAGDLLLMAWNGQYSTDIFLVTNEDLEKFYE